MSDLGNFFDQLETSLAGGIQLVRALHLIADNLRGSFKRKVIQMANDIDRGMSFAAAMQKVGSPFNEMHISFIQFGEETGCLDKACASLAKHADKAVNVQRKILAAMAYPMFLLFVAICFAPFMKTLMQNKPLASAIPSVLISVGMYIAGLFGLYFAYKFFASSAASGILLNIPYVGGIIEKMALSRFTRTLSIGLAAGVPLRQALSTAIKVTNNPLLQNQLEKLHQSIAAGKNISDGLRHIRALPNSLKELISVGEKSGRLPEMLEKSAEKFDQEATHRLLVLSRILPVIVYIPVAIYVASIILSSAKNIFSLGM